MIIYTFLKILDLSLKASIVILIVFAIRALLRKAPKKYVFLLWAAVWFRLLCPLEIHLPVYTVPYIEPLGVSFSVQEVTVNESAETEETVSSQTAANETLSVNEEANPAISLKDAALQVSAYVWLAGVGAFVIYAAISLYRLKKNLRGAMRIHAHVLISDYIDSPFVIGLMSPDIYLPSSLTEKESEYILLHENYHIQRRDPLWKSLAFAALALHWFNPLVWLSFALFRKDMEMSCDEAVIEKAGRDIRADYSETLLSFSTERKRISIPLAFDEGNPKGRIRHLSEWKKPKKAAAVILTVLCIVLSVLFLSGQSRNYDTCTLKGLNPAAENDLTAQFQFRLNRNVTRVTLQAEHWHQGNRTVYELTDLVNGVRSVTVNWIVSISEDSSSGSVLVTLSAGYRFTAEIPLEFSSGSASWYMNDFPVNYNISLRPGESAVLEVLQLQSMMTRKNLNMKSLKERDIEEAEDLILFRAVCHGGDNLKAADVTGLVPKTVTSASVYCRPDFHSAYDAEGFYKKFAELLESGEGLSKVSDEVGIHSEWMTNEYFEIVLNDSITVFAGSGEQTIIVSQTGTYTADSAVLDWLHVFCKGASPKLIITRLCGRYLIHMDSETDVMFEIRREGEGLIMRSEYLQDGQIISAMDYDIRLTGQTNELYEYDRPYADALITSSNYPDLWKLKDSTYRLEPDDHGLRLTVLNENGEPVMDSGIWLERE